jgi:putative spermidine/putrescine transport system ATP-binding protein
MNVGRIEQTGEPFAVYERPATPFVAAFLGRNNTFAAMGIDGQLHIGGQPSGFEAAVEGPFAVSLRAEKICLVETASGIIPGRILARVFQGNHWLFKIETPAGSATVIRQNDGFSAPREGESVGLTWNWRHALVLGTEHGARA